MKQHTVILYIVTDGSRTVAEARMPASNPSAAGTGSSGREPGDKYDEQTGEELAVSRALHSLANRLERRANGKVRHAESVKAHKAEIALRKSEGPQTVAKPAWKATLERAGCNVEW